MEETKILENHENLPGDNMKASNAHGEIKELISHEPSEQDEVLQADPGIPSAEKEPEAKEVISTEAVPNIDNQEQTLNDTATVKAPHTEENNIQLQKEPNSKENIQLQKEPNPKENSTEKSTKSKAPTKDQNEAKESTAAKDKTSKAKPPIEDPQVTETTEADQHEDESKDTPQANQEQKEKSVKTKSALKKPVNNEDQSMTPEKKFDIEEQELLRQGSAKEILQEQDRRKTWRSLLTEVSLVSSLSTFKLLYDKTSASESSDASVRKRNAKQLYKKKVQILRENYTYRLGLLKQLKEAMRDKYNIEAQQLYSDYTSSKRKQQFLKNTNIHAEDFTESKVTDPCEDPVALATLG